MIKLSANELPFKPDLGSFSLDTISFNRYPDKNYPLLKKEISKRICNESSDFALTLGNGSDELIWLIFAALLKAGDGVISHNPCFSEYSRMAKLCGLKLYDTPTTPNFNIDLDTLRIQGSRYGAKMAVICRPNNPTGELIPLDALKAFLDHFTGYVLLDEAYIEFSDSEKTDALIAQYPNLLLLRTLSKAYGLAGIRLGYVVSSPSVASVLEQARPPYNINVLTEFVALHQLQQVSLEAYVQSIVQERKYLESEFECLGLSFCPSQTNFLLLTKLDERLQMTGDDFASALAHAGIHIRSFSEEALRHCVRVSVGTPEENRQLLEEVRTLCAQ